LARAWESLAALEARHGVPYHTALRAHCNAPDLTSADVAQLVNAQRPPDEPLTAASVRKYLERARRKFAETLVDEVARTLASSSLEDVAQELADLGLHVYCKNFLEDRAN